MFLFVRIFREGRPLFFFGLFWAKIGGHRRLKNWPCPASAGTPWRSGHAPAANGRELWWTLGPPVRGRREGCGQRLDHAYTWGCLKIRGPWRLVVFLWLPLKATQQGFQTARGPSHRGRACRQIEQHCCSRRSRNTCQMSRCPAQYMNHNYPGELRSCTVCRPLTLALASVAPRWVGRREETHRYTLRSKL